MVSSIRWSSTSADDPGGDEPGHRADQHADGDDPGEGDDGVERGRSGRTTALTAIANRTRPVPSLSRLSPSTMVDRPAGTRQALERRDDGGRIGRRHHRADDERQVQPEPGRDVEHERDDRRRDHDARDGQQGQAPEPAPQLEDPAAGTRPRTRGPAGGRAGRARGRPDARVSGDVRADADEEPGDDQRDRVREPERPRDDRDEGRQAEQADQQLDRVRDLRARPSGGHRDR